MQINSFMKWVLGALVIWKGSDRKKCYLS